MARDDVSEHTTQRVYIDAPTYLNEPCEWCRGRGVYAHENIETGQRNAIDCPHCKGTGKEPHKSGFRRARADDYTDPLRGMIERGEIEPPDAFVREDRDRES